MITELKENQIFIFGSNLNGHHLGGAAKQAYEDFGAEWGVGEGLTGDMMLGELSDFKCYEKKLSLKEVGKMYKKLINSLK